MRLVAASLVATILGCSIMGCSARARAGAELTVSSADYLRAVDIARDVLLESRFEIDRVDAAAGVITSQPRASAGLLTPWDPEQTTLGQEISDASSTQRRRVRITFEPAAIDRNAVPAGQAAADLPPSLTVPTGPDDLRSSDVTLTARVEVFIDRVRRPGTRLETESIRTSTTTIDPDLASRRMLPEYTTTVDHDELLAGRLAQRIRERLAE